MTKTPGMMAAVCLLALLAPANAQWKKDVTNAAIPNRPAQGMVAGKKFVVEKVEHSSIPSSIKDSRGKVVATIRGHKIDIWQGKDSFDKGFTIFLTLPEKQKLEGYTLKVKPLKFGADYLQKMPHFKVPNGSTVSVLEGVHMGHRPDPKSPPQGYMSTAEYSLNLQCGKAVKGKIPCRIYLSMPDKDKSYVCGTLTLPPAK